MARRRRRRQHVHACVNNNNGEKACACWSLPFSLLLALTISCLSVCLSVCLCAVCYQSLVGWLRGCWLANCLGASLAPPTHEVTTQKDADAEVELSQLTAQLAGLDDEELRILAAEGSVESPANKHGRGGGSAAAGADTPE